jgi:hypothetical protein
VDVLARALPTDLETVEEPREAPLADVAEEVADSLDGVEVPAGALDAKQPGVTSDDVQDGVLGLLSGLVLRGKKRAYARALA